MMNQSKHIPDLKYLLVVLSLVVTLGLWNVFAREGAAATAGQTASTTAGTVLPTLIPLSDIALPDKPQQVASPVQDQSGQPLREVSQPDIPIVQNKPPVVEQVSLGGSVPASNNPGNAGAPAPVTSTGSSK